jgi:predicted ATPase
MPDVNYNDVWMNVFQIFTDYVNSLPRTGPITLLLDEPDRSLSIDNTIVLWQKVIPKLAENVQIITATHSPFALFLDANYLDLKAGYLQESTNAVKNFVQEILGHEEQREIKKANCKASC